MSPTPTFAMLGVAPDLVQVLTRAGITDPFPVQAATLPDALAGRDVCGKAETGSGKTLAFGIPVVQLARQARPGRPSSLILAPTRELALQITTVLTPYAAARGLRLLAVYGGVSMHRQIQAFRGVIDIVVATPGRLNDLLDQNAVAVSDVEMVVLDEADQMADMGFLPQVDRILRRLHGPAQTLLFSATLDDAVSVLVSRYQRDPVHHEIEQSTLTLDNVEQRFVRVTPENKIQTAAKLCRDVVRSLIFVRTQRAADRVAQQLEHEGVGAGRIHGGMSQPQRERVLRGFSAGTIPTLVATNVAARGIHVSGVDTVIHFDMPDDYKTYVHRSGRTGRAGASGLVVTLVLPHEERDAARLQVGDAAAYRGPEMPQRGMRGSPTRRPPYRASAGAYATRR
ncbi:MAG: DEAD/DEAH box helicase [Dehalococcoidia bacterium]|nr:DEAD/DEAH box helicase [Dehalococcoidia bacterium]